MPGKEIRTLYLNDESPVFDLNRCCQCGACIAACPHEALYPELSGDGLWLIRVDRGRCTLCRKCVSVCPAPLLPERPFREHDWNMARYALLAYAKDNGIRRNASSGGVARVLVKHLVDNGFVETAYTLRRIPDHPWAAGDFYRTPVNVADIPNSMYLPILVYKNLRLRGQVNSILLVGTTCQLLAAERIIAKSVKKVVKIAILCKQQNTLGLSRFLSKRMGATFDLENTEISFRGEGWPGKVRINDKVLDYEVAVSLPAAKRLWMVPGCRFCPNPVGIGVDITLADPWGMTRNDNLGKTMAVIWNDAGDSLMRRAGHQLATEPISLDDIKISVYWQAISDRQKLIDYRLHKPTPLRTKIAGVYEKIQTACLEKVLIKCRLPEKLYRTLAHLPDLAQKLLVDREER